MILAPPQHRSPHFSHAARLPKPAVTLPHPVAAAHSGLHPTVQAKLKIGAPDDRYELEADRIADRVCGSAGSFFCCGERLAAHEANGSRLNGGGTPLPAQDRAFFEPRFGADLSNVNIHVGAEATRMADALQARAFTVGRDIVFGAGEYPSGDRKLLAHELAHVVQQTKGVGPALQRQPKPEPEDRVETIKQKVRRGEKLTQEEIDYMTQRLGKEIVDQLLGNVGQIGIDFSSSRPPQDLSRRFRGRLELRLTGIVGAVASSLEGAAEADIDIVAKVAEEKAVITIAPPAEDNRMAAMIRQQLFPNNNPRMFDFKLPKKYIGFANAISLLAPITISLAGKKTKPSGAMIVIRHESVPDGVELIITLAPSARTTSVEETKRDLPGNYRTLTPNPRIFATGGYQGFAGKPSFVTTIGADFPLFYDTSNPLIYGGLGVRGSLDTSRFGRVGGNVFLGLNLDPLTLQAGLGAGAAFLPSPIQTPDGPAQTLVYYEAEGVAAYRIVSNLELMLTLTAGGGKKGPGFGAAQIGAAYRF
ncbi:MAG TPA: DUF4157 domain-containing protein [Chthoniobacterales bacterium]